MSRDSAPSERSVLLELQGGFSLTVDGEACELPLSGQRVLALLALHERPLLRVYVATRLWPGSSESRAVASLRSVIWRLQAAGADTIVTSTSHLILDGSVRVDVRETRAAARRMLSGEREIAREDAERVVDARELLPDWYDEWVLAEREQFDDRRIRALEHGCEALTRARRFAEAAQAGLAAIRTDRLRESSHRALIGLHLAEGNQGEALRRYDAYRSLLRRHLGLAPSPLMEALLTDLSRRVIAAPPR